METTNILQDLNNMKTNSTSVVIEDFEKKKEIPKKKKVVLALPGDNFSSKFLIAWTSTLNILWESGKYDLIVAPGVSSYVTFARMQTLGLDVLRGIQQKPFDKIEFDVWLTIDSDIIFTAQQVIELIESTEQHPVVSGMYRMHDLQHYAIVKEWDTKYFSKNGTFEFITPQFVENWKQETGLKYLPVHYAGMGFFAVRADVLRKMTYPYFQGELQEIITDEGLILRDICSEDVCFCKNILKLGYQIVVNTDIRVGHNKPIVI
jgi:hypothetical protein